MEHVHAIQHRNDGVVGKRMLRLIVVVGLCLCVDVDVMGGRSTQDIVLFPRTFHVSFQGRQLESLCRLKDGRSDDRSRALPIYVDLTGLYLSVPAVHTRFCQLRQNPEINAILATKDKIAIRPRTHK